MVERRSAYLSLLILATAVAVSCRSSSDHAAARSPLAAFKDAVPSTWPYPIDAPPAVAAHGMIATDAPLATRVGAEVLRKGGNAKKICVGSQVYDRRHAGKQIPHLRGVAHVHVLDGEGNFAFGQMFDHIIPMNVGAVEDAKVFPFAA